MHETHILQNHLSLSEKEKLSDRYLKAEVDASINSIRTLDRQRVLDAYNVRNGIRDVKDFEYLWAAYGIEFPSQFRHIPTLRAVFDSLLGRFINRPFKYQVSATDDTSVKHIFEQYRDSILEDLDQYMLNRIKAAQYASEQGGKEGEKAKKHLADLKKKYESGSFISDLEIDAKNILTWAIQRFKLKSETITMADDYITCGEAFYQVKVTQIGRKPLIKVLNPLNVYYSKTSDVKFIKDCERVVVRERLTVAEVWTRYGHKMEKKDQDKFLAEYNKYIIGSDFEIVAYDQGTLEPKSPDERDGGLDIPLTEINYVEWKANVKVPVTELDEDCEDHTESATQDRLKLKTKFKYRLDRFHGTKIGTDIYVDMGRDKFVVRDPDNPSYVALSVNGACYNDRNGEPYSLPLKTKDLADKIDILHYHAENLLALSGSKAVMINYPDIPAWIEGTPTQRVMKWLGILKQGVGIMDTSQEGQGAGKFNNTGSIDLSLTQSLEQIYRMADALEGTAYKIVGVPRQAVGNITETDGKGTSELAIQGSEVVTQPLFTSLDQLIEQFLTDVINACRIAYSKGLQGSLILGETGQKIFSIKSKQFSLAHFNVWINGEGDIQRDLDEVKAVAMKLVEAQMLDAELAIDMVTIKSLTEIKKKIKESIQNNKENENSQLVEQIEQYKSELQKAQANIEKLQAGADQIKQAELQLNQQKAQGDLEVKNKAIDQKSIADAAKLELDAKRVDLEALQLRFDGGGNKEIRNN